MHAIMEISISFLHFSFKKSQIYTSFLPEVTSPLWSFTAYQDHLYCSYHPLSIVSPPFHHPFLHAGKLSGSCSHIKLNNSYKFNRHGIWTLRSGIIWGILPKQNACSVVFDVLTTALAIQRQSGVIPVRLHVQEIPRHVVNLRVRRSEVSSNSCFGHFIFYRGVRQCDVLVSQRLTKNSLLQGEMGHFKGRL